MILFYIVSIALFVGSLITLIISIASNASNKKDADLAKEGLTNYVGTYYAYTDTQKFTLKISKDETKNGQLITSNYVYDTEDVSYDTEYFTIDRVYKEYGQQVSYDLIGMKKNQSTLIYFYIKSKNPIKLETDNTETKTKMTFTKEEKDIKDIMNDPKDYYGKYQTSNGQYYLLNSDYSAKLYNSSIDNNPTSFKYFYANTNYASKTFSKNSPALILYNDDLVKNKKAVVLTVNGSGLTDSNNTSYSKVPNSSGITPSSTIPTTNGSASTSTSKASSTNTKTSTTTSQQPSVDIHDFDIEMFDTSLLTPTSKYYTTNVKSNVTNNTNVYGTRLDGCAISKAALLSGFGDTQPNIEPGTGELVYRDGITSDGGPLVYYLKKDTDSTLTEAKNPLCIQIKNNGIKFNIDSKTVIMVYFTAGGTSGRAIGLKNASTSSYLQASFGQAFTFSGQTTANAVYYESTDHLYYNNSSMVTSTDVTGCGTVDGYALLWIVDPGTYYLYGSNQMRIFDIKIRENYE